MTLYGREDWGSPPSTVTKDRNDSPMNRIHIVGRKNHGKTTLVVALIEELTRRGVVAGSIKHSSHHHVLDTPGKDSFRHRAAGADPAAVITRDTVAVFSARPVTGDSYAALEPLFAGCEVVLVEGDVDASARKVEVWREAVGGEPLAALRGDIIAVVSDGQPAVAVPVWPRSDVAALADHLLRVTGGA